MIIAINHCKPPRAREKEKGKSTCEKQVESGGKWEGQERVDWKLVCFVIIEVVIMF